MKCFWYKNVDRFSFKTWKKLLLSLFLSKEFYLLFENIHPLWYLCAHGRSNWLQHDIKKLLFDTLKLLFKLFAWVFLEKQTLKLTLIIVNLESHAIDKKWKGEHSPSPLPLSPDPLWIWSAERKIDGHFHLSFLSQNVHYNLLHFLWKKFWNLPGLYLQATESNL